MKNSMNLKAIGFMLGATIGLAQTIGSRPEFEVASIKSHNPDNSRLGLHPSPGRFDATGVTLKLLMQSAYRVQAYEIFGAPGWIASETYDVVAKADGNADREQVRLMLQMLLEERFKLKTRRETRELPIYALVVRKNGPRLSAAEGECPIGTPVNPPRLPVRGKVPSLPCGGFSIRPNQIYALNVSTDQIAQQALSPVLQRRVVDKTGLTGRYFIELEWAPNEPRPSFDVGIPSQPVSDSLGPDVLTAIQEQLGLKLESQKGPVEVLIIDHVEKPGEN
jgi:uncharacterized protein (TIGR03435 family)